MAKGNSRPFVQAACVCEQVLHERDGVFSLVRIVDTVYVTIPENLPPGVQGVIEYPCFISLKSGDLNGSFKKLRVRMTTPNGEVRELADEPIETIFTGGEHGINIRVNLKLAIKAYGLGWIDVLWEEDVLSSIPLRIRPKEQAPESAEQ